MVDRLLPRRTMVGALETAPPNSGASKSSAIWKWMMQERSGWDQTMNCFGTMHEVVDP